MRRILFTFTLLATAFLGARAQYASDGYIDSHDEDWLHRGYRGNVCIGGGPQFVHHGSTFINAYTSHGFQFNEWAYVGGGIGVDHISNYETSTSFILFANPVLNLPLDSRFSPFVDLQIGGKFDDDSGLYFSASAGCRYAVNGSWGINFSIGVTLHTNQYWDYSNYYDAYRNIYENPYALVFRIGVDLNL